MATPNVVMLEVVEYTGQFKQAGGRGFFGTVIARTKTEGFSPEAIEAERQALRTEFGEQVAILDIELVPEVGFRPVPREGS